MYRQSPSRKGEQALNSIDKAHSYHIYITTIRCPPCRLSMIMADFETTIEDETSTAVLLDILKQKLQERRRGEEGMCQIGEIRRKFWEDPVLLDLFRQHGDEFVAASEDVDRVRARLLALKQQGQSLKPLACIYILLIMAASILLFFYSDFSPCLLALQWPRERLSCPARRV